MLGGMLPSTRFSVLLSCVVDTIMSWASHRLKIESPAAEASCHDFAP
jgi:hypothetical protein